MGVRARSARRRQSVLMIASEAVPLAKTGGLADVIGALPGALADVGWDVTVVMPRYRGIAGGRLVERRWITVGDQSIDVGFFELPLGRVRTVLVDAPALFDRPGIYGEAHVDYPDNAHRFALLARAALEYAADADHGPSVVHAHDWQAGLVPVYLRTRYADHPVLGGVPSVFTIHNLAYQGLFEREWMPRIDLAWNLWTPERLEFWGHGSFLKGGINYADIVTTVSENYAHEIQTPAFGCGFDGILRERSAVLVGIRNGIDTEQWDPARDPLLPRAYSASDLSGKRVAKAEILGLYGLPSAPADLDRPLIGMISRMVDQKGFDLIAAVGDELMRLPASFVVLGTGEARYQDLWRGLAQRHPDRVGVRIGFDERMAHLIEAGADIFLMPSRFEPCGLNQMYSLRYGTVPVVRKVGGLADTVRGYGGRRRRPTGFVFEDYAPGAMLDALRSALGLFANPTAWRKIQTAGMAEDFSWTRSAREYVKIYRRALAGARPATATPPTAGRNGETDTHGS